MSFKGADTSASPGDTFASDDTAIVNTKIPKNKLGFGVDGTYTDVSTSNPLPVAIDAANVTFTVGDGSGPLTVDGTVALAAGTAAIGNLGAGAAIIGKVGIDQTTDGTTNAVHLVAGTALAGKFGIDQTTPGTTNNVVVSDATGNHAATMDVVARKGFVAITDGTSAAAVKAASTAALATDPALVVRPLMPTDGTNTEPVGSTAANGKYVLISDGARVPAVKPASNVPVATDQSLVVSISPNTHPSYLLPFVTTVTLTSASAGTAYSAGDAWADSLSAPTAGGFSIAAARVSGGSVLITDLLIGSTNNAATALQGELHIFNSAVTTAPNDNAIYSLNDADLAKLEAIIPFTLSTEDTNAGTSGNATCHINGLAILAQCSGSANLRYLMKVKSAYTPLSGEQLTIRLKGIQIT